MIHRGKVDFPKISIITPFFNAEPYIKDAIQSVLDQTYQNWELILINDGSVDSSKDSVFEFLDDRICYFEQYHAGVAAARNVGLKQMKGDYFCFLDADDTLPPGSLMARLNRFESDGALDFVDGRVYVMDASMEECERVWTPDYHGNPFDDLLSLTGNSFFGLTWMIKRKGDFDYRMNEGLSHSEDLLFFLELSRQGGEYGHTTEPVLRYRNSPGSATKQLRGFEAGYRNVYAIVQKWEMADAKLDIYKRRTRGIMFRSYLRKRMFQDAFRVLTRWI